MSMELDFELILVSNSLVLYIVKDNLEYLADHFIQTIRKQMKEKDSLGKWFRFQ